MGDSRLHPRQPRAWLHDVSDSLNGRVGYLQQLTELDAAQSDGVSM